METGTRHRTGDRLSQQTGAPVVVVSASMSVMSLFLNGRRYPIERPEQLLARANQALATLSSYRARLVEEADNLTMLEVRDQVQVRDVAAVAQRVEMWRRIDAEVRGYVSALGVEGRLVQLQRNELSLGVEDLGRLLTEDYRPDSVAPGEFSLSGLQKLPWEDLLDVAKVAGPSISILSSTPSTLPCSHVDTVSWHRSPICRPGRFKRSSITSRTCRPWCRPPRQNLATSREWG